MNVHGKVAPVSFFVKCFFVIFLAPIWFLSGGPFNDSTEVERREGAQVRFSTWVLGLRLRSAEAPINNPGFEVCFWLDNRLTTEVYYY